MIKILTILMLLSFPAVAQETKISQQNEQVFFESLYDVPLMPNMSEVPDMALSFDKPTGRIAYATAQSADKVTQKQILAFYAQSLPQMGWKQLNSHEFTREGENLRLSFTRAGNEDLLQFMLYPAENSGK